MFRLEPEHIGKKVRAGVDFQDMEYLIPFSFDERDWLKNYIYKMKDGRFFEIEDPHKRPKDSPYNFSGDTEIWELWTPKEAIALPPSIEALMKDFGCQKKQTRQLVTELVKLIQGETK
jgi:hypothetical protein